MFSIVVSSLEFATWLMEGSELIPQHHLFAVCRPGSALFGLCFWTCQFAAGANWAGQGTKWFVMSLTNELTNRFGVGSVDFHGNLASCRVLEMSREQSRCDNNFSLCRSKLAARYFKHRALSFGQPLSLTHRLAGTGSRATST